MFPVFIHGDFQKIQRKIISHNDKDITLFQTIESRYSSI